MRNLTAAIRDDHPEFNGESWQDFFSIHCDEVVESAGVIDNHIPGMKDKARIEIELSGKGGIPGEKRHWNNLKRSQR